MKPSLPVLLSVNGGYVDTAGFLALQGLFTAHVTGNFVTAGAALVFGTSGVLAKLLALPVFCVVVALVRLGGHALSARDVGPVRVLLWVKLVLLFAGFALALHFGPFPDGDAWPALLTGLTLVSAMAVQNGVQIHLPTVPPSTLMTGNTTQVVIDAVDLLRGLPDPAAGTARRRLAAMAASVASFAAGCAAAALMFAFTGMWCFALPVVVAFGAVLVRAEFPAPAGPQPAPRA